MAWHLCSRDGCGHSLPAAILLHHGVKDVSAVEAAPARHPHTFCAFHEIEEVIFRHTTLTTCTGHDALLVCLSSHHKSKGSPLSRLDPKEVPQMKGDVTQPAFIHDGSPSRRSRQLFCGNVFLLHHTCGPSKFERARIVFPAAYYMSSEPWMVDRRSRNCA